MAWRVGKDNVGREATQRVMLAVATRCVGRRGSSGLSKHRVSSGFDVKIFYLLLALSVSIIRNASCKPADAPRRVPTRRQKHRLSG